VFPWSIKVKDLISGVDTGIGSATAMDANRLVKNFHQSRLDEILNSIAADLTLPTIK
jgi:hypothetical protein